MDKPLAHNEHMDQLMETGDYIDLSKVSDINRIFSELNRLKAALEDISVLKGHYAEAVNELYEVTVEDSRSGEEISSKALSLGMAIQAVIAAGREIMKLESELEEKYGFLRSTQSPNLTVILGGFML
ncbi:MAG: hypothetical protein ACM3MK_09275 [Chitinophagales bacterium]